MQPKVRSGTEQHRLGSPLPEGIERDPRTCGSHVTWHVRQGSHSEPAIANLTAGMVCTATGRLQEVLGRSSKGGHHDAQRPESLVRQTLRAQADRNHWPTMHEREVVVWWGGWERWEGRREVCGVFGAGRVRSGVCVCVCLSARKKTSDISLDSSVASTELSGAISGMALPHIGFRSASELPRLFTCVLPYSWMSGAELFHTCAELCGLPPVSSSEVVSFFFLRTRDVEVCVCVRGSGPTTKIVVTTISRLLVGPETLSGGDTHGGQSCCQGVARWAKPARTESKRY